MKITWFLFVATFIICFSACQTSVDHANHISDAYQISKSKVERDYLKYGETEPFMNEYGEVILSTKLDSTLLEYCKDSSVSFHPPSGKFIRNNNKVCYPAKVIFVNNKMLVRTAVESVGNFFSRSQVKGVYSFEINETTYTIHRLFTLISEDEEGANIIMHTNEYWSEELGLILKMDENFMKKRKRIIRTKNVTDASGKLMETNVFFNRIYQDSSSWITKKEDGTPWF